MLDTKRDMRVARRKTTPSRRYPTLHSCGKAFALPHRPIIAAVRVRAVQIEACLRADVVPLKIASVDLPLQIVASCPRVRAVFCGELINLERGKIAHAPWVFLGFASGLEVTQVTLELAAGEHFVSATGDLRVGRTCDRKLCRHDGKYQRDDTRPAQGSRARCQCRLRSGTASAHQCWMAKVCRGSEPPLAYATCRRICATARVRRL